MPRSILTFELDGVISYCIRTGVDKAEFQYLVFKTDKEENPVEKLLELNHESTIEMREFYSRLMHIMENESESFTEVITDAKTAYVEFLKGQYYFNVRNDAPFDLSKVRPLESFDLLKEYFLESKKLYLFEQVRLAIDEADDEFYEYYNNEYTDAEIEKMQVIIKELKKLPVVNRHKLKATKRYYNWLSSGLNESGMTNSYELQDALGAFDKEETTTKPKDHLTKKLIWKGQQKQLVELFDTLEKEGWIEPVQDGDIKATAQSIMNLFEFSTDYKGDVVNSLYQVYKGEFDTNSGVRNRDLGKRYKPNFDGIKPLPD